MATYFAATGIRRFFLALFAVLPSFPLSVSPCLTFLLSSVILCVLLYCGPLRLYLLQTDVPSYLFLLSFGPFSLSIYTISKELFLLQTLNSCSLLNPAQGALLSHKHTFSRYEVLVAGFL